MSPTGVSLHINFKYTIIWYNAVRWPHIFRQVFLPKNLIYLNFFQKWIKLSILDILSLPPLPWDPFLIRHPQRLCYISILEFFSAFCQIHYNESHSNPHIPTPLPKFFSGHPIVDFISTYVTDIASHPNWKLLDRKDDCGHSSSDRIIGGYDARLGQYPWIVRLGYAGDYTNNSRVNSKDTDFKPIKRHDFIAIT